MHSKKMMADKFYDKHPEYKPTDKDALCDIMKTLKKADEYRADGDKMAYMKCLKKAHDMIETLYEMLESHGQ